MNLLNRLKNYWAELVSKYQTAKANTDNDFEKRGEELIALDRLLFLAAWVVDVYNKANKLTPGKYESQIKFFEENSERLKARRKELVEITVILTEDEKLLYSAVEDYLNGDGVIEDDITPKEDQGNDGRKPLNENLEELLALFEE